VSQEPVLPAATPAPTSSDGAAPAVEEEPADEGRSVVSSAPHGPTEGTPGGVAAETAEAGADEAGVPADHGSHPVSYVFYGLGLSLQVILWFLLFLAIVIAVAVGGQLTEFRYVGF
jgi:hypothetical protein